MFKPFHVNTQPFYIYSKPFYVRSQLFDKKTQSFYLNAQLFKGTYYIPCSIIAFPRLLPLGRLTTPFLSCCYAHSHVVAL
jgi:hypothetical protein